MVSHSSISTASNSGSFPASSSSNTGPAKSLPISSSPPSTASSSTAFSRSDSPPPRQGSKLFPFPTLRLTNDEHEKPLPGPGAGLGSTSSMNAWRSSLSRYGWRKRRGGQAFMLLGVLGIVGLWLGGVDLRGSLGVRGEPEYFTPPQHDINESHLPEVTSDVDGALLESSMTELPASSTHQYPKPEPKPPDSILTWGVDLETNYFTNGLTPWLSNPPINETEAPLSELGHFADNTYKLGALILPDYEAQLSEFAIVAFPNNITERLNDGLRRYLGTPGNTGEDWDEHKRVWQTDKDTRHSESSEVRSWKGSLARDEGWSWDLLTDQQADDWVSDSLGGSRMKMMWDNLPSGILRSDTLRYLLLLLEGGIYSDTDTVLLKSPSLFGRGAKMWRDGSGWLDERSHERISAGEGVDTVIGKPSVIVGVEADVGSREDWFDWWPRPIQIVQWTMATAPNHPIALSAVLRVLHSTADAVEWSHVHATRIRQLEELGRYDDSYNLLHTSVLAEPKGGGPLGVMAWTGPGVWTDAVLSYLRIKFGMTWTDLKGMREPLRVGDVVILPVTGFSPGVGNFGSKNTWHREAMVEHGFRGSWKDNGK